jgi:hypothetical protein
MAGFGNFYELLFSFYRRLPEAILTHEIEVHLCLALISRQARTEPNA